MVGLILFAADDRVPARLPRARALPLHDRRWSASSCCCCRACPASAQQVNGAYLASSSARSLPAGRVREDRDHHLPRRATCATRARCSCRARGAILGITLPPLQALRAAARGLGRGDADAGLHPRPRLVADVLRRVPGAALRGDQPAVVRARRAGRCSRLGAWFFGTHVAARARPRRRLAAPVPPALDDQAAAATRSRSRCSRRPTAGCSAPASAQALLQPSGGATLIPAPQTDLIYAVIVNELGLFGACGLLLVYLLFAERGFKTAMLARDWFSKLLATGLIAVFALQVFVIVGGVTRVIPLTGVTLPFVSYGGSSIVANFVLLALLLIVSDQARRPAAGPTGGGAGEQPDRPPLRARRGAVRAARRLHVALDRVRRAGAAREPGTTAARCSRSSASSAGSSAPTTAPCWPRSRAARAGRATRAAIRRTPVRARGRLLVDRPRARRASSDSYNDALSGRETTAIGAISTSCSASSEEGDDLHTTLDAGRPEGGARGARRPRGRGRGARLRPGEVRVMAATPATTRTTRRTRSTVQPRDAGPLPAGLDVQGRDRRRGARHRPLHADLDARRHERQDDLRRAAVELRRRGLRPVDLTTALTHSVNTVWAQVGEKLGKAHDGRLHAQVRLLRGPADGLPGPPDAPQRRVPQRQAAAAGRRSSSTSAAWRSGRTSCWSRRCRWRRWRRRSPTAACG